MVTYVEPPWPLKVFDEAAQDMVESDFLMVTIYVWHEGMRIHLPFLPFEAAYEEVVRRCELALGGRRLPPTVWFTCRACGRRLSLANDPQRRMPGGCRPNQPWEWNLNIPFKVFITVEPDPMSKFIPMRMPSKYEKIEEVLLVSLRAVRMDAPACRLWLDGKKLCLDSTVEECGIKENDHLILELLMDVEITISDTEKRKKVFKLQVFSLDQLSDLLQYVDQKAEDITYIKVNRFVSWRQGDDLTKTLWELSVRDRADIKIKIPASAGFSHIGIQTVEKVPFSCQTEDWQYEDWQEED